MRKQSIERVGEHQAIQTLPWQCAWCVEEAGEKPAAGHTHGICERHYREVVDQAHVERKPTRPVQ